MARHADDWNVGRASEADIFARLSEVTGLSVERVTEHAAECCSSVQFHAKTWSVVTEHRLPQALVTVNPDLFVERVAGPYELSRYFDVMVVSGIEGTDDKSALCDLALARLGLVNRREAALLIDNRRDLVDAWQHAGGSAYWYRGDDAFASDPPIALR